MEVNEPHHRVPQDGRSANAHFRNDPADPREAREKVHHLKERARDEAERLTREIAEEAKGRAQDVRHEAQDGLKRQAEEGRRRLAARAHRLATAMDDARMSIDAVGEPSIAGAVDSLAANLDRAASYLDNRDLAFVVSEAEDFARARPAVFLGGALAVGFAVGRFLRSSNEHLDGGVAESPSEGHQGENGQGGGRP